MRKGRNQEGKTLKMEDIEKSEREIEKLRGDNIKRGTH